MKYFSIKYNKLRVFNDNYLLYEKFIDYIEGLNFHENYNDFEKIKELIKCRKGIVCTIKYSHEETKYNKLIEEDSLNKFYVISMLYDEFVHPDITKDMDKFSENLTILYRKNTNIQIYYVPTYGKFDEYNCQKNYSYKNINKDSTLNFYNTDLNSILNSKFGVIEEMRSSINNKNNVHYFVFENINYAILKFNFKKLGYILSGGSYTMRHICSPIHNCMSKYHLALEIYSENNDISLYKRIESVGNIYSNKTYNSILRAIWELGNIDLIKGITNKDKNIRLLNYFKYSVAINRAINTLSFLIVQYRNNNDLYSLWKSELSKTQNVILSVNDLVWTMEYLKKLKELKLILEKDILRIINNEESSNNPLRKKTNNKLSRIMKELQQHHVRYKKKKNFKFKRSFHSSCKQTYVFDIDQLNKF